jgi:hypothetical protein
VVERRFLLVEPCIEEETGCGLAVAILEEMQGTGYGLSRTKKVQPNASGVRTSMTLALSFDHNFVSKAGIGAAGQWQAFCNGERQALACYLLAGSNAETRCIILSAIAIGLAR